jgi:Domain of unknown function (DUF4440)
MKVRLLTLAGLAIGFASPAFAQEKAATPAAPNPFQALPANPSLVQQVEAINLKFDEACNKHDREALETLFTANAIHISPDGRFIGRDAIGKYYGDLFHRHNLSGRSRRLITSILLVAICVHSEDGLTPYSGLSKLEGF